jgi:hypothetical protein
LSGIGATTPPSTANLILRGSEEVGRKPIDPHAAWDDELIYPNVRVSIDQSS